MDVFYYLHEILMHVLDVYVSWTTDGCNECARKSSQERQWRNRLNPYLICCHCIVHFSVVN